LPVPDPEKEPEIKFFPPEAITEEGDGAVENLSDTGWDQALHYHEIKKRLDEVKRAKVRASAIRAIIQKALATMGAVQKPYELKNVPWNSHPQDEFDLESTLEEDPSLENLMVEKREPRRAEVIICIDTSLSMTGRKLALTAVALAVLALQLEPEDYSVIAFESDANLLKPLGQRAHLDNVLEKFMEVPARGLTNIEAGLLMAEKQAASGKLPKKAVILMTDGRYTAGKNPEHVVPRLPRLHVVQTGNPWSSPRFCRSLARIGRGKFVRVAQLEHLPKALYTLVNGIIR
jgi:Mg-chelatase subunit ChlD